MQKGNIKLENIVACLSPQQSIEVSSEDDEQLFIGAKAAFANQCDHMFDYEVKHFKFEVLGSKVLVQIYVYH
ncbi:hypothetical protein LJC51_07495 [Lachnospiraceae bacterium OttesenSCG-928-J05]|nr:hypothetical protein [Lachnospiraceae bacterium OttesenSCG-928-J05]